MIFFPFRSKVYKTTLSPDEIFDRLRNAMRASSSSSQTGEKNDKSSSFEMTQEPSSFVIGKSTSTAKRGLMDTEPVVKGKLKKENGFTSAKITIQPRSFILPAIGLAVIIPAVYFGITKFDFLTFLLAVLLVVMVYSDLVIKFNRLYKAYREIIESVFQNQNV